MRRFRFVHVGVAAALAAATVTAIGLISPAGAATTGTASSYVPITPCRLIDTRADSNNVGTRATPIGPGEAATFPVWGTHGNCTIPTNATGLATNVTAVNPTASSYITIYPADAKPRPAASNLNVVAGGAPTPNQVTVGLSATGAISAYNNAGTVDLLIDIVGYYQAASTGTGTQGPKGDKGDPGKDGAPGPTCPAAGCEISFLGISSYGSTGFNLTCVRGSYMELPLTLPVGAIITKVTIQYNDADPVNSFNLGLYQTIILPTGGENIGTASDVANTVDSSSLLDLTLNANATTPVGPLLSYFIFAGTAVGAGVYLCGADVTYHF